MKQIFTTFLFLIYAMSAFCQQTKPVTNKFSNTKQISESYFVLKSDGQTKHGEFISYFQLTEIEYNQMKKETLKLNNYIKEKGNYNNGKKDGEWLEYSRPFEPKTKGQYNNGKKVGIWLTYKEQGQVIEKYDYDNDKKLDPIIETKVYSPQKARDNEIQGVVKISYRITKDCTVADIQVIKGVSNECDKEAKRVIEMQGSLSKKYGLICDEKLETKDITFTLK